MTDRYLQAFERGEHDEYCEQDMSGFYVCHCRKRSRLAKGITEVPGPLIQVYPTCRGCWLEVEFEDGFFICPRCHVHWPTEDEYAEGEFNDDHGDEILAEDKARWLVKKAAAKAREEAARAEDESSD